MDDRRRSLLRTTSALLLLSQLAGVAPVLAATAPAKPAASASATSGLVPRAQGYYRDARYDEAVGLLSGPVMRKELAGQELIEARLVLARCYVKKGITPRAKEHFAAILAIDPAYTLDKSRVDADEYAVWNDVKGVPAAAAVPPAAAAAGKGAAPDAKTPPATTAPSAQAQPPMHKPETGAAGAQNQSWFSKNKYLALGLLVGTGVAVGVAMGGGGDDGSGPAGPTTLQPFPSVPGGH